MPTSADLPEASAKQLPDSVNETQVLSPAQPKTFRGALYQAFLVFDRESNFILQLLVVFMCSVAVVPAARQALQPVPVRVSQLPTLTQQMTLPEPRPQQVSPAQPKQYLVSVPVVKRQPLPARSSRVFAQPVPLTLRKNYTPPRKAASHRPIKRAMSDPIAPVRSILKQDYQISQASGSYERYMTWVRNTLKSYQSES